MTVARWLGGAPSIAQIDHLTVGGTIEAGDLFLVTIGQTTVSVAATTTDADTTANDIASALADLDVGYYPQFAEIEWSQSGSIVVATARTPGKPFTITVSTTEANGAASDGQTFARSASVANSGPNDAAIAGNWSAVPAAGYDLRIDVDAPDILYNLEQYATVILATFEHTAKGVKVGLPDIDENGYPQYRPKFFKVKTAEFLIRTESGRAFYDWSTGTDVAGRIEATGSPDVPNRRACCLKGGTASSSLDVLKGSVGLSMFAGETSQFPTLRMGYVANQEGDAQVYAGPDCTLGTITKNGGVLTTNSNTTSITNSAGNLTIQAGATTALVASGGEVFPISDDTYTTISIRGDAQLDWRLDPRPKTVTNPIECHGAEFDIWDEGKVINSGAAVFDLNQSDAISRLHIGPNTRVTLGTPA